MSGLELSVVIPAYEEGKNMEALLQGVRRVLDAEGLEYEVVVVDAGSKDDTRERAVAGGARVLMQERPGYGGALAEGFKAARGRFVLTMDSDLSHEPEFMKDLLAKRHEADVVIASRYVPGGASHTTLYRKVLSWILNKTFRVALSLPVKDMSSGFRLYRKGVLDEMEVESRDFDVLEEVLIKAYCGAWRIEEIPFVYRPRAGGRSHAKVFKFGISYLRTLYGMWQLRNSVFAADYDDRAFNSKIPLQRYWQRKRFQIVRSFLDEGRFALDVGCGSSRIIKSLPKAVGLDIQLKKLRYLRETNRLLVNGTLQELPFRDGAFGQVICSEVIEHVPEEPVIFSELWRVLEPGGILIIGTPDYGTVSWRILEWGYAKVLPRAYAEQHITHYTRETLTEHLRRAGFRILDCKYVGGSEMIFKAEKAAG